MRIYRRGRVYWIAYYDAASRTNKRVSSRLTDRTAAIAFGAKLERYGADPDGATAADALLSDALDALIAEYERLGKERRKAKDTVEFYRKRAGQLLRMISDGVLPAHLSELRPRHVDAFIDQRRIENSKRSTIAKDLITLRLALKLAKRRGLWKGDIDEILPHRFGGTSEAKERWLSMTEVWGVLPKLLIDRSRWVAFAIATGANYSEAKKARRDDVRAEAVHLRGTKRATRDRMVPIVYGWQRALLGLALSGESKGLLFRPWTNSNMTRDLTKALRSIGAAPASSNDLRRTFGTWMRASGAPLELIAPAMGHADTRMVERVYGRLDVSQLGALLEASRAVPHLYVDPSKNADPSDVSDAVDVAKALEKAPNGSSCWTRTSDPVINSRQTSEDKSDGCAAECAQDVRAQELKGLAKAVRLVGLDFDYFDLLAAGGEG